MAEITDDFRRSMSEWVELKKQLTEARNDMKVLNNREKELKSYIAGFMKQQKIDNINLSKGKVALKTSTKKGAMTAAAVKSGLCTFCNNDETEIERAMNCIMDNIDVKETSVVSLTGVNTKKKET